MPITHHDHPGISYGRFAKRPYKIIDKRQGSMLPAFPHSGEL
jgi:hypothetical protein